MHINCIASRRRADAIMDVKNQKIFRNKKYIYELIEEGEHECQDFKFAITDSRKIARSIAAFANNKGGRLLVGVKDNGMVAGIRNDEEIYMIEQAAERYCKPAQSVEQTLYCVDGKYVLKVDIPSFGKMPVLAQDDNGKWQVYYRVADENVQAPDLFRRMLAATPNDEVLVRFTDAQRWLLQFISKNEVVTLDEIALSGKLSRETIEESVVRLCKMELLTFCYHSGEWKLKIVDSSMSQ